MIDFIDLHELGHVGAFHQTRRVYDRRFNLLPLFGCDGFCKRDMVIICVKADFSKGVERDYDGTVRPGRELFLPRAVEVYAGQILRARAQAAHIVQIGRVAVCMRQTHNLKRAAQNPQRIAHLRVFVLKNIARGDDFGLAHHGRVDKPALISRGHFLFVPVDSDNVIVFILKRKRR